MSKYFWEALYGATICQKCINFIKLRPRLSLFLIQRDFHCFINYFSFALQAVCSCYSWAAHASLAKAVLAIDRPALCENMLSGRRGEQPGLIGAQGGSWIFQCVWKLSAFLSSLFSSAPSSSQWIIEVQGDGDRGIYFSTTSGEKDAWMDGQPCPECKSLVARWNVAGNGCLIFSVTAPLCLLERLLRQYRLKTNKTGAVWVTLVRQNQCRCSSISTLFRVQLLGLTIWRLE